MQSLTQQKPIMKYTVLVHYKKELKELPNAEVVSDVLVNAFNSVNGYVMDVSIDKQHIIPYFETNN